MSAPVWRIERVMRRGSGGESGMECGPDEPTGRANARPMTGSAKSGLRLARWQFDLRCPRRVAAAAAAGMADEVAGVVHRAIQVEPGEVREQYQEGDPQRCLGHSIHVNTRKSSQGMSCRRKMLRHKSP
jgi:hypothetical protein